MLHQLSIGHLVQYASFVSLLKNAARQDRRDKIDELFADDGLFGLNPTLSELFVVLVAVKYQLKEPLLGAVKKETFRSGESETRTSELKQIGTNQYRKILWFSLIEG